MKFLVWTFLALVVWYFAHKLWDVDQAAYEYVDKRINAPKV